MSVLSSLASQKRAASRGYKRPMCCEAGKKMRKKKQRGKRDERKMREKEAEEGRRRRRRIQTADRNKEPEWIAFNSLRDEH